VSSARDTRSMNPRFTAGRLEHDFSPQGFPFDKPMTRLTSWDLLRVTIPPRNSTPRRALPFWLLVARLLQPSVDCTHLPDHHQQGHVASPTFLLFGVGFKLRSETYPTCGIPSTGHSTDVVQRGAQSPHHHSQKRTSERSPFGSDTYARSHY
jgi:hypothetical protein